LRRVAAKTTQRAAPHRSAAQCVLRERTLTDLLFVLHVSLITIDNKRYAFFAKFLQFSDFAKFGSLFRINEGVFLL